MGYSSAQRDDRAPSMLHGWGRFGNLHARQRGFPCKVAPAAVLFGPPPRHAQPYPAAAPLPAISPPTSLWSSSYANEDLDRRVPQIAAPALQSP